MGEALRDWQHQYRHMRGGDYSFGSTSFDMLQQMIATGCSQDDQIAVELFSNLKDFFVGVAFADQHLMRDIFTTCICQLGLHDLSSRYSHIALVSDKFSRRDAQHHNFFLFHELVAHV